MSKAIFVVLLVLSVLIALVSYCSARPIIYTAIMSDTRLSNVTNGYRANAIGLVTITKGRLNHRLRVYGVHNILNDTITAAWLVYTNQTKVAEIGFAPPDSRLRYVRGDVRLNVTVYGHLLSHTLGLTIYTERFPDGATFGVFHARPNTGVAGMDGSSVVPPASNDYSGLGYAYIANPDNVPLDLIQQTNLLLSNATFDAQIIHNVTNATSASYNTANTTATGPVLANIPLGAEGSAWVEGFQPVTGEFYGQQILLSYLQVDSSLFPAGAIRGQVLPTLGRTRRAIPEKIDTIFGVTNVPGSLNTLRWANQQGTERNDASFISLVTTQVGGAGNFTYQGFFHFEARASRRNFDIIRGLTLELNVRQFGAGTWNFDYFDASTGAHVPTATFSTPGNWTIGIADYFQHDASSLNTLRKQLVLRITATGLTSSTLWIDLFGIRSYEPTATANIIVRDFILQTSLFDIVFSDSGSDDDDD
jgi:hypothetical protein